MDEPSTSSGDSQKTAPAQFGHPVTVAVSQVAVTRAVRRASTRATAALRDGRFPTARDPHVPFRRIVLWAAVAAADVAVDRACCDPNSPNTWRSGAGTERSWTGERCSGSAVVPCREEAPPAGLAAAHERTHANQASALSSWLTRLQAIGSGGASCLSRSRCRRHSYWRVGRPPDRAADQFEDGEIEAGRG
jgi:hypothetical protein